MKAVKSESTLRMASSHKTMDKETMEKFGLTDELLVSCRAMAKDIASFHNIPLEECNRIINLEGRGWNLDTLKSFGVVIKKEGNKLELKVGQKVKYTGETENLKGKIGIVETVTTNHLTVNFKGGDRRIFSNGPKMVKACLRPVKVKKPAEVVTEPALKKLCLRVVKVIYSKPATIVFYQSTESSKIRKSVAVCKEEDTYIKEIGLEIAITKAFRRDIDRHFKLLLRNFTNEKSN